jgi:hypothetical protein
MVAERRAAFYALAPGSWRDYWTLLHPPYTVWHLSYVMMGAAIAPHVDERRLAATMLAFFLGVGVAAHALDELHGRPLATRVPQRPLLAIAFAGALGSVGLGVLGAAVVSWWLLAFVGFGAAILVAYNLEWANGRFHSDTWFALAWGGFPVLTSYFAQTGALTLPVVLLGAACVLLSLGQRRLSTPVRLLRRRVVRCEGRLILDDGTAIPLSLDGLRAVPEGALRAHWIGLALLAGAFVAWRMF